MKHIEHEIQKQIVKWARLFSGQIKELHVLHAIPNGGKRNMPEAVRLKAEGVLAGMPDLHLPVARNGYNSLYIEIKTQTGRQTKRQKEVQEALEMHGNLVLVCRTAENGIKEILNYLKGA